MPNLFGWRDYIFQRTWNNDGIGRSKNERGLDASRVDRGRRLAQHTRSAPGDIQPIAREHHRHARSLLRASETPADHRSIVAIPSLGLPGIGQTDTQPSPSRVSLDQVVARAGGHQAPVALQRAQCETIQQGFGEARPGAPHPWLSGDAKSGEANCSCGHNLRWITSTRRA